MLPELERSPQPPHIEGHRLNRRPNQQVLEVVHRKELTSVIRALGGGDPRDSPWTAAGSWSCEARGSRRAEVERLRYDGPDHRAVESSAPGGKRPGAPD